MPFLFGVPRKPARLAKGVIVVDLENDEVEPPFPAQLWRVLVQMWQCCALQCLQCD
jgi:hypothetical protein